MATRGQFITFEGIEGAGKSTQIKRAEAALLAAGHEVVCTREPGGTPFAEDIRNLILTPRDEPVDARTEVLLVFAARAQHVWRHIVPALERGVWVLCDRFTDASYAYQGAGRGLGDESISILENYVQGDLRPDLTLIFDLDIKTGFQRVASRGESQDRFESETLDFFEKIRATYLRRATQHPERYRVIDASKSENEVQMQLLEAIKPLMEATA